MPEKLAYIPKADNRPKTPMVIPQTSLAANIFFNITNPRVCKDWNKDEELVAFFLLAGDLLVFGFERFVVFVFLGLVDKNVPPKILRLNN